MPNCPKYDCSFCYPTEPQQIDSDTETFKDTEYDDTASVTDERTTNDIEQLIEITNSTHVASSPKQPSAPDDNDPNKDEMDLGGTSADEIIRLFDERNASTQFDIQHPGIYFDKYGYAHGTDAFGPLDKWLCIDGKAYELDESAINHIGAHSDQTTITNAKYLGKTNRQLQ